MAIIQTGSSATGTANVNANHDLQVALPTTHAYMGGVRVFSENDPGTISGAAELKSPETSNDYRLRVGLDTLLKSYTFNATTQNTGQWKHAFTTMTMTQSAGFLNINAAGTSTVANNYAFLQTWQYFPLVGTAPLYVEFTGQINAYPTANEVFVAGLGIPSAAAEPTDGVYWRLTSAGLVGVIKYSGSETVTDVLVDAGDMSLNTNSKYCLSIGERAIEFWINDVLYDTKHVPNANGQPFMTTCLPVFVMKYNSSTVGNSPNMIIKVSDLTVTLADMHTSKPWAHQMAGMGMGAWQGQDGGTMAGTATYANSANPTAAAPQNTALTANLPAGLGGQGLATLWNLAATDMIFNQYLNPVGGVNQTPRTLYITGIKISAAAFTATWTAPAAGQHLFQWGLGWGAISGSLAATETGSFVTATTKIPRRKTLGLMGWATTATPIGTPADRDISVSFDTPIVVNPSEYINVICKMVNGAASATGAMYYTIDFDGYFE